MTYWLNKKERRTSNLSIEKIQKIFAAMTNYDAWSLQLLKIKTSKRDGTSYSGREINFKPSGTLNDFVTEISNRYTEENKGVLKSFLGITDYDGSTIDKTIYRLLTDRELIHSEYNALITAIATPDAEIDPLEFKAQAYLLKGMLSIDGVEYPVKLVSMQNPVTTLNHKFWMKNGEFQEISDKVLSLRPTIDVVIFDDCIYMLTLAGENLFNMERSYKAICTTKMDTINECNIVTDFEAFSLIAGSGHNPRKFVSFNDTHLQKLKNANTRKKMAKKFNISLDGDKFDTTKPDTPDKLVKLLCDRGMVDPFDDNPMEVAGSKKWV